MEPPELGSGAFSIRQAGQPLPSAWVFSTGSPAGNDEHWVWISGVGPGGDANRILRMANGDPSLGWTFMAMPGIATPEAMLTAAQGQAPAPAFVLSSALHQTTDWP